MMNLCKYVFALAVWLMAAPLWAATLVQTATGANSCSTATATFGVAVTNGNSIIVALTSDNSTVPTPSDGTNTYTQVVARNSGELVAIYRATNVTGSITTVSLNPGNCVAIVAYEVAGLAAGNDGFNSSTATNTSAVTNSVTTTGPGIVISAVSVGGSTTITPSGSGWTQGYENESFSTMTINSERQLSGGAATFSDSWTLGASNRWNAVIAAFKDIPPTIVGCRLLQDGVSKRLLQNGTDGRIFQGGGDCALGGGGGGPTVVPVQMLLGVGL